MSDKLRPAQIRGDWTAEGLRFGIVVSRFNSFITERLLAGALDSLARAGAESGQIELVRVPGSFEIPLAAKKLAASGRSDAIVCIGCILRGDTQHFEYVASETARGVQLAQLDTGVPMIFCVLTCDSLEQAVDRSGLKGGNKGAEAGLSAVEMANLARKLSPAKSPSPRRPSSRRTR
ncbi:MAG TPA: 6,7-dimethyl-8-ribityllumazine synthase [Candidatus Dormibacteraeota bacterium]|nr:6,7-dimethyl-8-ribityllumazine synthase [Candidatus Dormibacteraeota bacterium]